jgi:hypothetical protein
MSEDKKQDRKSDKIKRRFGQFWSTSAIAVIICFVVWKIIVWNCRSPDDQLAAINTARAIPESEDAGVAYRKLVKDFPPLPDDLPGVDGKTLSLTLMNVWSSQDYPKVAAWLDGQQDLISKLLNISKLEKCRFPILSNIQQWLYLNNSGKKIEGWTSILIRSANLDSGEARIDAAIEKYACVIRMSYHLRQQLILSYYRLGATSELLALEAMKEFISKTELAQKQLMTIEAALLPPKNMWKQESKMMVKVHEILQQKQRRPPRITDWHRYWEYWKAASKTNDPPLLHLTHTYHLLALTYRRRMYILISLQRYKNRTGHWPQSLDRIKPLLPKEAFIDPDNNKPFVYKMTGEDFSLSIRGAN